MRVRMNMPYFRKKRTEQGTGFPFPLGMSLLFVSFLALCIFSFAVLSLLTARNAYRISRKIAEHQSAYYAASNKAEDRIAELNAKWKDAEGTGQKPPEKVSFQVEIDSGSSLSVVLETRSRTADAENDRDADTGYRITDAENDRNADTGYRITEWKVISTGKWEPETTIPVMTPGVS
ncbi:MAG: hypothetical protein ACOYBD_00795 [Bilifractor sp.]|jgi:hypothetical protein